MKISCQSCGAKYNIADDKVRGKIVKIACKKCGARIEIDGREPEAQAQDQDETRVFDQASAPPGAAADSWTVSIDDNDQREVSTPQLVDLIRQGTVTPDTFVWRDGMADWQAVRDISDLQHAMSAASVPPPAAPAYPSEPPTAIHPAAGGYDAPAASPSYNGGGPMAAAGGGYGAPQIETSQPARLGGSRRGGAVDLFAAQPAGAEDEDVATSAPPGGGLGFAPAAGAGGKPIGARNENSVLFSLSALTASGPANAPMPTGGGDEEKSGLIDIQKLAAAAKPGNGSKDDRAKLDDIMNLGGGGAFGSALGAPILAPPPAAALSEGPSGYGGGEEKKSNKVLILAMGGVVTLLLIVVIILLATRKPEEVATKEKDGDKKGLDVPKDEKTAKAASPENTAAPAPTDTAPTGDPDGPIGKPGTKPTGGGTATAKAPTATGTAAPDKTAAAAPTSTSPASKCTTLDCAMGNPAKDPPKAADPPKPAGDGEPDKAAVKAALGGVPYKDCGTGGAGKVQVTFGGSGSVSSAVVTSGSYDGGTKSCIQNRFKSAKIPAYGGPPKSYAWSVNL